MSTLQVVLVDDNHDDRVILGWHLRKSGIPHTLTELTSCRDALPFFTAALQTTKDSAAKFLVIVDLNLSDGNGLDLLEDLDRLAARQSVDLAQRWVVLVLTATIHDDELRRARRLGFVADMLEKPLTRKRLLRLMAAHYPDVATAFASSLTPREDTDDSARGRATDTT